MQITSSPRVFIGVLALTTAANGLAVDIEDIRHHLSARDVQSPYEGLPGCSNGMDGVKPEDGADPTWVTQPSAYEDGKGYLLGSDCDNQLNGDPQHCWTDYFLTGSTQEYGTWYIGGAVRCDEKSGNGTSCAIQNIDMRQSCITYKWEVGKTIGETFGLAMKGITASFSQETTTTEGQDKQHCQSLAQSYTCTWGANGGMHTAWFTPLTYNVFGYMRRSCASALTGQDASPWNNAPKRADGNYTRGIKDFHIPIVSLNYFDCTSDSTATPPKKPDLGNATEFAAWDPKKVFVPNQPKPKDFPHSDPSDAPTNNWQKDGPPLWKTIGTFGAD